MDEVGMTANLITAAFEEWLIQVRLLLDLSTPVLTLCRLSKCVDAFVGSLTGTAGSFGKHR